MFGFFAMAYAAVRSMIDIGKDWSFEEGSRNRSKQEGRDVWVDSKGRFRDMNTGHIVFTGDERVNGELHRVMRDMKTGRILKDYTVENKRRREYEDAEKERLRIIEATKRSKLLAIDINNERESDLKMHLRWNNGKMSESERHKYAKRKYYGGDEIAKYKIKGKIYYNLETDERVFLRYINLVQLHDLIDMSKYKKFNEKYDPDNYWVFNLWLFMSEDGKFIDFEEERTFMFRKLYWFDWFTNDDIYDIIDKLNEKGDYDYWNKYEDVYRKGGINYV